MNKENIMKVLLAPHMSEKSSTAMQYRQYVFKVAKQANKRDIKAAVEALFKVSVDAVCVMNVKGKKKRFGNRMGQQKSWKKAFVKLAEGNEIDWSSHQA